MQTTISWRITWILLGLFVAIVGLAAYPLLQHQPQSQVFRRTTRVQIDSSLAAEAVMWGMDAYLFPDYGGVVTHTTTINNVTTTRTFTRQQDYYGVVFHNTLQAGREYVALVGQPIEQGGIKRINFYRIEYAIGEEQLQFLPYPYRGVKIYTGLEVGYEVCHYNQPTCEPIVMTDFLTAEPSPARKKALSHKFFSEEVIRHMRHDFTSALINAGPGSFFEQDEWLGALPVR
ncbi:MAG TPA: hypothetical protein DEF47_22090 [Herpetosiphon sp.]|uniref:Uncharacterized protein n=1 Tax=Herpetosiphon aurantiacus (strain ATCC 23779 / DSM 785 / 114-95) TaxID=316274 RepID=A9AW48_HERA2|nr:hypothetical protein [Herpetosiphon sp.]ABX03286.1 hypothetical protein Haur_0638 [Herpetosiphon aurantiacus DSM 785]HBW52582.1 hypothetical protein [Herpetosiphon sp.]